MYIEGYILCKKKEIKCVCTSAYCCKKKQKGEPKTNDTAYIEKVGENGWKGRKGNETSLRILLK